jgi:hypothetical protein
MIMSFTTSLDSTIGKIRMELGDDSEGRGVLPDGANLSDEQIDQLLVREGAMMRALAAACELLALRWAGVADLQVGPRREALSQIGSAYAVRAGSLRARYGFGAETTAAAVDGVFSVAPVRVDGYVLSGGSYQGGAR